jgi:dihydrofolate synthase/folylpolyglutamate synthase
VTYHDAIEFLYSLRIFGARLGLENTFKLAALAGDPQKRLRFIHVAGTNGKGSTCAMLESIYRTAGLRVGLYTSPHLVSFGERIQINRRAITEREVVEVLDGLLPLLKLFPEQAHPTFFEVITIMALRYFEAQNCDLVIWETGLGGRLDATNIVTPLASVITSLAMDHEQWLGGTIEKIAFEKAGIIKPSVPVITSATPGSGLEVLLRTAHEHGCPLTIVDIKTTMRPPLDEIRLPLSGEFQRLNAALALATVRQLNEQFAIPERTISEGLQWVYWPGRMQLIRSPSGQTLLLDGAHNPAGAEVLRAEAQKQFAGEQPAVILGVLRDKDWRTMGTLLAPITGRFVLTPVKSQRSLSPEELAAACREANPQTPVSVCSCLAEALKETQEERSVIITGSLYLVGEALEVLGLSPAPESDERRLNEWGAALR